ncbi:hypothetical protein AB0M34_21340 [Nocardia sp. NPDC050193]
MTAQETREVEGFGTLFDRVSVMHASDQWSATAADIAAVCGEPRRSDETGWATWESLSVSDETAGPAWCLLARTADMTAVVTRARALGWQVGDQVIGGHEQRVPLVGPSGLTVVAYSPIPAS